MKKSRIDRLNVCLLALAMCCMWTWSTPANAQSVDWEILPLFDSDWGGSQGQPATTNGNVVTLYGRPVRTVQTFSGAQSFTYDVLLPARNNSDGNLQLFFLPTGVASNHSTPNLKLTMGYRNPPFSPDFLTISSNDTTTVWGEVPFTLSAQTVYHCAVDVSAFGVVTWAINNVTNSIPNTVKVPYTSYQLEFEGWQPDNVWQVSNFAVVPEPSTGILVAVGVGLLAAIRRRRSATNRTNT